MEIYVVPPNFATIRLLLVVSSVFFKAPEPLSTRHINPLWCGLALIKLHKQRFIGFISLHGTHCQLRVKNQSCAVLETHNYHQPD
jgi:hypothetical protein